MSTPILSDVRRQFPSSSITAMGTPAICELLSHDPRVNRVECFYDVSQKPARKKSSWKIAKKLYAEHYDLGLLMTGSFSSAAWFWFARIPRRIGFIGDGRSFFLTDPIPFLEPKTHQVQLYKQLLQPLGIMPSLTTPKLYPSYMDGMAAENLLVQRGYCPGSPLIGIHVGAAYGTAKCWLPERFRELVLELSKDPSLFVVFFGDTHNRQIVQKIFPTLPPQVLDVTEATRLSDLVALIQKCDLLITNDSGPMHIGAAVNTPLVALFGSTDNELTGPWGQPDAVINKHTSCAPCFKRTCPTDFCCMRQIEVSEVLQKAQERRRHV